jgi:hypothetical protein
MGLFNSRRPGPQEPRPEPASQIPVAPLDLSKRYDVYCSVAGEERLYEDGRFLGIRTFDPITELTTGVVSGYLEIETADGARLLIPQFGIELLCEHGTEPVFTVLRRRHEW